MHVDPTMDSLESLNVMMVDRTIAARGVCDQRVLSAMKRVQRHRFVPPALVEYAADDRPLPIGEGQTISQPYVVALMLEAAALRPGDRVLEVGTGSGYAAAVASLLCRQVISIERHASLAASAADRLDELGFGTVEVRVGDGTLGCLELAPFNAILVTAGGLEVPAPLLDQLASGGRLVMPVGSEGAQTLVRITKYADGSMKRDALGAVRFVPLIAG
jgi:protein-L-isoaspartate(D-aspartate) O-methyltransferase